MTDPSPTYVHIGHPPPAPPDADPAGLDAQPAALRRVPAPRGPIDTAPTGRAQAAADVRDAAIDAALDAMVAAAPPLDEPARRRLSQLLRQRPGTTARRRDRPHG